MPEAPDELVDDFEYTDESLLLTYDLECEFVLPFKSNSLQSAFVVMSVEVSVDAVLDRGIEAVVLLFSSLFSTLLVL